MKTARGAFPSLDGIEVVLLGSLCATVAAYSLTHGHSLAAIFAGGLPLLIWTLSRPAALLALLGASIPFFSDVAGREGGSYNVAASDLVMVVVGTGIALAWLTGFAGSVVSALQPIAFAALQYAAFVVLLIPFHPLGIGNLAQSGQRLELYLLPLLIGSFAVMRNKQVPLLKAYVISAAALGVIWPVDSFGMQHNPVGQMIGSAIVLLIGYAPLSRLRPLFVVLVPSLLLTESRGAIIATGIGIIVMLAIQGFRLRFILVRAFPIAVLALIAFFFLPSSLRARVTTISAPNNPSLNTTATYPIFLRQQFTIDAKKIIDAHPWVGVGVGNYTTADAQSPFASNDPHEVLYLQAAEGGYGFAVSFVVLLALTLIVLRRMRAVPLAPVAAGVLVATFVHGLADVYWVRGTPLLGWLLVGMTCAAYRQRQLEGA